MAICGIYKITNKINGKVYIGQSKDIYRRWKEHEKCIRSDKRNTYLYNSMRKHGIDNFAFEIIEECDISMLNTQEIYWIAYYNSHDANYGYNGTIGGDGVVGYGGKPVHKYTLDGEYVESYKSVSEAIMKSGLNGVQIASNANGTNKSAIGYQWSYEKVDRMPPYKRDVTRIPVHKYDLNGNYIESYESRLEAGKANDTDASSIALCCNGKLKSSGGFLQSNDKVDCIKSYYCENAKRRKIYQYSLDAEFIREFNCALDAHRETGISYENIIGAANRHNGQIRAGDYLWTYDREEEMKPYLGRAVKPVACYDKQGKLIAIYNSAIEAKLATGVNPSNIGQCCKGKRETAGGFCWKYV